MVAFKTTLALLISAVSAIPTSAQWPKYDINGKLQDSALDRRAPAICQPSDKDVKALRSNKANGSAFCSTYLQSTKTVTTTPLVTSYVTDVLNHTVTHIRYLPSTRKVYQTVRTTVMKTVSTAIKETQIVSVTDLATKTMTNTMTDISTDTETTQVTEAKTEQLTEVVTEQVTNTITKTINLTSTMDVTDIDTQDITVSIPTTVTVTVTGAAPTTSDGTEYHCDIPGYGNIDYMENKSTSVRQSTWDSCKSFCVAIKTVSFGLGAGVCACFSQPAVITTNPSSTSKYRFYDIECPSQSKPVKRAVSVKQVPSYLPLKDPRVVSSACSCHISNKPATAITQTLTAKEPSTVLHVATSYSLLDFTVMKPFTIYIQATTTVTDFKTLAITDRTSETVTQRKSVTVTNPVTVTVTNYKTMVVTKYNTVGVTNRNTIHITNFNTAPATAYNTVLVTNVAYLTVTEYDTVLATDIATNTVIPDAVTVYSYIWGA